MTDGKKEGRKHRPPRGLKIAMWVVGGIIAFLLLIALLVGTPPGGRLILNQAGKWLETSAGYRLEAGSLRINLFRLKVTLTDFRLQSVPTGQPPSGSISGDRLAVQMAWSTLTGGPIRIKNLEIKKPRVSLWSEQPTGVSEKNQRPNYRQLHLTGQQNLYLCAWIVFFSKMDSFLIRASQGS